MNQVGLLLCAILLTVGSAETGNATLTNLEESLKGRSGQSQELLNLVTNGNFANGLSGWTIDNAGHLPLGVSSVDIDGQGPISSSDAFFVQTGGGYGSPDVSISQGIKIAGEGAYTLTANIAAAYFPTDPKFINNLSGGIVTVTMDGKTIDSFDFGTIASNSLEYATLNASFETASPGILEIDFFRPFAADMYSPINYLDNVSLTKNSSGGAPVPEPATGLFLAIGLLGLLGYGRKKFKISGIV